MDTRGFSSYTVDQLKAFLRKYGVQCTNHSKSSLLSLALAVRSMDMEPDPDFLEIDTEKCIADKLLTAIGDATDPWEIPSSRMSTDLSQVPAFSLCNVFNYLIFNRADYDNKKLKAYKSFDDYRLFFDGHVQVLEYAQISQETFLFRSKVKPTQRQKTVRGKNLYQCWFVLRDEHVILAFCECPGGGDGACRHIGAALYELESCEDRIKSCTDEEVKWIKRSRQSDDPSRLDEIVIKKPRYGLDTNSTWQRCSSSHRDVRHPTDRHPPTDAEVANFASKLLQIDPQSSALDILMTPQVRDCSRPDSTQAVAHLQIIFRLNSFIQDIGDGIYEPHQLYQTFIANHAYTDVQQSTIDDATAGRSKNPTWHDMRRGMITASVCKRVFTRSVSLKRNPSLNSSALLQSLTGIQRQMINVPSLEWGRRKEKSALSLFEYAEKWRHVGFSIEYHGLIVDQHNPFTACSPDGIMRCKCHEAKLIEVKCPYTTREEPPHIAARSIGCIKNSHGDWRLPKKSPIYYQIQTQMGICNIHNCTLVIYTKKGIKPISIDFDMPFYRDICNKLEYFAKNYLFVHLLKAVNNQRL